MAIFIIFYKKAIQLASYNIYSKPNIFPLPGFMNDALKIEFKHEHDPPEHNHLATGIEKHIKFLNNPIESPSKFEFNNEYEKTPSFINFDSTPTDRIITEKPNFNNFRVKSASRSLMSIDFDETLESGKKSSEGTSTSILGHILFVIANWFNTVVHFFGKIFNDFTSIFVNRYHVK